ncbi:type I restriction endonuclease subunit R [candidate division CSSED10-310 bacterium]|uniref:Type I restriction endonuclease subunit R n=1 Tax=candidate division CSSED10-310 bacterium TaxID=2855610 RepID=A0ABV6Z4U0_UNCC1
MTPSPYTEQDFEDHIEGYLLQSPFYFRRKSAEYDRDLCLIPAEFIEFIQATQNNEFRDLEHQYGADTANKLCLRLSREIDRRGVLQVLRKGIKDRGVHFRMAYFKPASGMNLEHRFLYGKNRFAIVRQLQYSKRNTNTLDLCFFLNGIPIITAELKNSLTGQFVEAAIKQYKQDRDPKEALFRFKRCLVHLAVGNEKVFMTTRLQGFKTRFLPFNKDFENPVNPQGHKTAYLWQDILQAETLLDFIKNYLLVQRNTEKYFDKTKGLQQKEYDLFIFPRFHQLDVVRKLLRAVKRDGVGHNYLVQHSAGSGKSNSIAWLAHQLASLYQDEIDLDRMFDSIIVVTDRRILDRQLQNTIKQFEQTTGVVKPIDMNSAQLRRALAAGKDIIITTIQKFSVIAECMSGLRGSQFAVIIDEAHSSQSGESAKHLKKVLSVNLEEAEAEDHDDFDLEETILHEITVRGKQPHISYFAFTATPKNKTLELFGHRTEDGRYVAHHIYSMRQAIEEGFILDVLHYYTTFKRYFKLLKTIEDDQEYEKKKATRLLTSYVDLQPHAINVKSHIILDHFLSKTVNAIQGRGRAMLVTRSRLHAVKYFLMLKRLMAEKHLPYKPLVAFSGTVKDPDTSAEYTELSLCELPPRVNIVDAFKTPEYRLLVVANKFQTGFDEPMLHTMYVDKKLGGVNAVQTLSRLNRTFKGKSETLVLDFVNDAAEIQASFQPYYQTTLLEGETEPNKLYELHDELLEFELYTLQDIDDFAVVFYDPMQENEKQQPILDRVVEKFEKKEKNEREDFRSLLQSYIRFYGFVSQFATFRDVQLEKLYVFAKNLNRKLPKRKGHLPYEVLEAVDLDSFRIQKTYEGTVDLEKDDGDIKSPSEGVASHPEEEKDILSHIIQTLNETYGTSLTEDDKVDIERSIKVKLEKHEELTASIKANNTRENIRMKFDKVVDDLLLDFIHTKLDLYKKLSDPKVNPVFKNKLFDGYYTAQLQSRI